MTLLNLKKEEGRDVLYILVISLDKTYRAVHHIYKKNNLLIP